jgi:Pentapeptide repeats (8 copies)
MANQEHLDILEQGVEIWNQWRQEYPDVQPALSGADLGGARLRDADLSWAHLNEAHLRDADLSGADLCHATLVETDLTRANLTHCFIYGISVWNVKLEGARQDSLIITPKGEPTITVDDLEVAQFIYLLLSHQKLRNVLNAVTAKGVLILGRFGGGGLEVLQAIAAKLREGGYLPILFDFERPRDQDYTETIMTLAGLSHFIIADLSGPSVPQELSHTVPFRSIPLVPIIEKGKKTYSMFPDFMKYPWVIKPPIKFRNIEQLQQLILVKIIPLAEKKQKSRQKQLEKLFPRKQGGEDTKSKTA